MSWHSDGQPRVGSSSSSAGACSRLLRQQSSPRTTGARPKRPSGSSRRPLEQSSAAGPDEVSSVLPWKEPTEARSWGEELEGEWGSGRPTTDSLLSDHYSRGATVSLCSPAASTRGLHLERQSAASRTGASKGKFMLSPSLPELQQLE